MEMALAPGVVRTAQARVIAESESASPDAARSARSERARSDIASDRADPPIQTADQDAPDGQRSLSLMEWRGKILRAVLHHRRHPRHDRLRAERHPVDPLRRVDHRGGRHDRLDRHSHAVFLAPALLRMARARHHRHHLRAVGDADRRDRHAWRGPRLVLRVPRAGGAAARISRGGGLADRLRGHLRRLRNRASRAGGSRGQRGPAQSCPSPSAKICCCGR